MCFETVSCKLGFIVVNALIFIESPQTLAFACFCFFPIWKAEMAKS